MGGFDGYVRYYYAVITCDTVDAASHIYNELQGTELERSANVFDLSFVPDDMTFDNEPRYVFHLLFQETCRIFLIIFVEKKRRATDPRPIRASISSLT